MLLIHCYFCTYIVFCVSLICRSHRRATSDHYQFRKNIMFYLSRSISDKFYLSIMEKHHVAKLLFIIFCSYIVAQYQIIITNISLLQCSDYMGKFIIIFDCHNNNNFRQFTFNNVIVSAAICMVYNVYGSSIFCYDMIMKIIYQQ